MYRWLLIFSVSLAFGACSSSGGVSSGASNGADSRDDVFEMDGADRDLIALADATDSDGGNAASVDAADSDVSSDSETSTVQIEYSYLKLPSLKPGFVYEGWLLVNGESHSAGRFASPSGSDVITKQISRTLAEDASSFVVTIEPKSGDEPGPSNTPVVADSIRRQGTGAGGSNTVYASADLSVTHEKALGSEFSNVFGQYILKTPTTAATDDYNQGIWFFKPAGSAPSLKLPENLPEGWTYEGFLRDTSVNTPSYSSIGRFQTPDGPDSDGAGPEAGPKSAPEFPGQDLVGNGTDLTSGFYAVTISVETKKESLAKATTPSPAIPIVRGAIGKEVEAASLQPMKTRAGMNEVKPLPSGRVEFSY